MEKILKLIHKGERVTEVACQCCLLSGQKDETIRLIRDIKIQTITVLNNRSERIQ